MSESNEQQECPKTGKISWNELVTSDPDAAIKFYTSLVGWETEVVPMPAGDYTMFTIEGKAFGGVMKTPREGVPTQWTNYVVVDDIDATLAQVTSLGGKVCMGPMDIPDVGRVGVIQDPQGATIGLHECVKK